MRSVYINRILPLTLILFLLLFSVGCAYYSPEDGEELTPAEVAEKLCAGEDLPPYEVVPLDETNFVYYAFVPYEEGLAAAAADALVNITPHSLVVIRAEKGGGEALAQAVLENADPNKWLCVGAETVNVAYTDHYVVLIMSERTTADALAERFQAIARELDGMEAAVLTAGNSRYEQ